MAYTVEPARPHDLTEVLELLRRVKLPEEGVVEEFGHFVVVRDEGHVVGTCGLEVHGPDGLLRSLAVDAGYRREGVGSLLVDGILDLASRMGLRDVYLLTTTAQPFFARRGFTDQARDGAPAPIQECWEFKTGCPASSALMKRRV